MAAEAGVLETAGWRCPLVSAAVLGFSSTDLSRSSVSADAGVVEIAGAVGWAGVALGSGELRGFGAAAVLGSPATNPLCRSVPVNPDLVVDNVADAVAWPVVVLASEEPLRFVLLRRFLAAFAALGCSSTDLPRCSVPVDAGSVIETVAGAVTWPVVVLASEEPLRFVLLRRFLAAVAALGFSPTDLPPCSVLVDPGSVVEAAAGAVTWPVVVLAAGELAGSPLGRCLFGATAVLGFVSSSTSLPDPWAVARFLFDPACSPS